MVDYTTPTGGAGTLIVRDDGTNVYAIVKNTSSPTFANGKAWSVYLGNGGAASGTFSISGVQEVVVWSGAIGTTMSFQFNIGATGTSGLGGPTTLNCTIQRATVPGAPVGLAWSNVGTSTGQINFNGPGSDGGAGIDYYLVRYGKSNPPENGAYVEFTTGTGSNPRTGLDPGGTYYARVYSHNRVGYSAPSAVQGVTVLSLPPSQPGGLAWSNVGTSTAQINFSGSTYDGGSPIIDYLVRYGKSNPPENGAYSEFSTTTGSNPRTGFDPGATYYAIVYARNAAGYSVASVVQAVGINPNVPSIPPSYLWTDVGVTTAQINFGGPSSDGGAGIDYYLVRYGKANPPENGTYTEFQTLNGANPRVGLDPGATYYVVIYAHNRAGYSVGSIVQVTTTLAPVRIKVGGVYKYAIPYVKVAGVYRMVQPYVKTAGVYRKTG